MRHDLAYVCGLGESWPTYRCGPPGTTYTVNDGCRNFTPDCLVVVDKPNKFTPERWQHIKNHDASAVFSQFDLDVPRLWRIELNSQRGVHMLQDLVDISHTSTFVACGLAYRHGYRTIALCGSDFKGHHLTAYLRDILRDYRDLARLMGDKGVRLVSIVQDSVMNRALEYCPPGEL